MNDLLDRLAQAEVFSNLPEVERAELARLAHRRRVQTGEFLCHQGDTWPNVIFLTSGQLRWAMLSAGGREYVLFTVEPGSVFWGHSIFDGQPMPASLSVVKASEIYQWSREVILPVLYRNPATMWAVTGTLVRVMRRAREVIYGLAFEPVAGRLAALLLGRFGAQQGFPAERDLTLGEIATMIATSQEVVCRMLHQFQSDGVLEITRTTIALRDRAALEKLVEMA